jgi:hypothetical protein
LATFWNSFFLLLGQTLHLTKPDYVKPIISSTFNSRGQVDLINMTAYPDGKMKWILHYQDQHDKMSYLCAMPSREAKSIALGKQSKIRKISRHH